VLTTTTSNGSACAAVQMTIKDANGNVVPPQVIQDSEAVTKNYFLIPGTYTFVFAALPAGQPLTPLVYQLEGLSLSDPIGPQPDDPTLTPVPSSSAPQTASFVWLPHTNPTFLSAQNPGSDPQGVRASPANAASSGTIVVQAAPGPSLPLKVEGVGISSIPTAGGSTPVAPVMLTGINSLLVFAGASNPGLPANLPAQGNPVKPSESVNPPLGVATAFGLSSAAGVKGTPAVGELVPADPDSLPRVNWIPPALPDVGTDVFPIMWAKATQGLVDFFWEQTQKLWFASPEALTCPDQTFENDILEPVGNSAGGMDEVRPSTSDSEMGLWLLLPVSGWGLLGGHSQPPIDKRSRPRLVRNFPSRR
jgi:hypothetical protein